MRKQIEYIGNCVQLRERFIHKLLDNAKTISFRTFRKYVSSKVLKELFPIYDWNKPGLHIQDDYSVSWFKSKIGKSVYYVCSQSSIEYVWRVK